MVEFWSMDIGYLLRIMSSTMILISAYVGTLATLLSLSWCMISQADGVLMKNETDGLALLAFKKEVSLDPHHMLSSWNASLHFCSWPGVTCGRKHRRVVALDLSSSGLEGTLTPHLGNLSFLRRLYLYNNSFYGEIPQELGRLFRLRSLALFNNTLDGNIPTTLSNCSNLIVLDLGNNKLEGGIPTELGSLVLLDWLSLQFNNYLGGVIPPSVGNLTSLTYLGLGQCGLQGTIPHQLGRLSKLSGLALQNNKLEGEIPPSIFSNMSGLQKFMADQNNLTGNLPLHIGDSFPNIIFFTVANNQMEGRLPHSLWNLTQLEDVEVAANNFHGSIPEKIGELANLYYLYIAVNNLGGESENDLQFITSLTNCTQLSGLIAEMNNFQGLLPSSIMNLSANLKSLYLGSNQIYGGTIPPEINKLRNLETLYLDGCLLTGSIPPTIGEISSLQEIGLYDNMLTGTIPATFGNLSALNQLILYNNLVEGYIPPSLGYCLNLEILTLSRNGLRGPIPPSLAGCTNLQILELNDNSLAGTIPTELFISFSSLAYLDLGSNRFSGPLLMEVGNLVNVYALNISGNQLSGAIPESLGSCVALEYLHLESNNFEGNIPTSLGNLQGLQLVNLSHNRLAGQIPTYFKEFKYLEYLDLSHNNLEGYIPIEGIFQNLSAISLQGNTKLCGGVPQLQFPPCEGVYDGHKKAKNIKVILLMVVLLPGSLTIVLVLCSIFMFRKRAARRRNSSGESLENLNMRLVSYRDIVSATNNFSSSNLIGRGSFGAVYKGVMEADQMVVAVKVINLEQIGASKSFVAECVALQNIRHRNLVKILTCCSGYDYTDQEFKALVYEFMENGTLESWLHPSAEPSSSQSRHLSLKDRLEIAIDVAHALDYLHNQSQPSIIHCDLKPSNILLDEEMVAHISDFGLAKILLTPNSDSSPELTSTGKLKGTIGYIPPEYGTSSYVTAQGDIFSYGVILLEMIIGKKPTHEIFNHSLTISSYAKEAFPHKVMEIVDEKLLPFASEDDVQMRRIRDCVISIVHVGIECSADNPSDRINMGIVKSKLEAVNAKLGQQEL